MTVTAVDKDTAALTMRITAEYDAPVERVWKLWSDPRLLERWWGPPTYPATFGDGHDLSPGAHVGYHMTGPEGDEPHGWWKVLVVEPPHRLEFEDGFAHDDGAPNPDMPTMHMRVDIAAVGDGARMSITTTFPSAEAMEQLVSMGMDEGMSAAVGQIDEILADLSFPSRAGRSSA
jgi:uncharacterized protein YndB with AHSA1/START domain